MPEEEQGRSPFTPWRVGSAAVVVLFVSLAVLIGTRPDAPTDVVVAESETMPAPSPSSVPPEDTGPIPTTAAVGAPSPAPSPTPLSIPQPTPEFGPSGRPSSVTEALVLTAKPTVRRPRIYDGPDGVEVPVTYTYLDGRVDSSYDHFTNPTFFGNDLTLMVVRGERGDEWAEVKIPTRPIMQGWVKTEDFEWSSSDYYVRVNIGDNTVKVWNGDDVVVDSVSVVTGDTGRSTPLASTFVDEIMPGPSGAYGPWLLSLGVFSDSINTFGGGLPKVALHGTNRPDLLGQYASNGCIRLPNDVIELLASQVPVGTRVDIVNET